MPRRIADGALRVFKMTVSSMCGQYREKLNARDGIGVLWMRLEFLRIRV